MQLKQGHYYHLELLKPYTHKGPLFVYFTAIVKKATMDLYGDFDIRGTFFDEVGLSTYLSLVNDDTDILICSPITSTDPIQVDDKNAFALPVSIVDYDTVEEWFVNSRFTFEVKGVDRYIPSLGDKADFKKQVESEIAHFSTLTNSLVGDIISVNDYEEEFLKSDTEIKKSDKHRTTLLEQRTKRNREVYLAQEQEYLKLLREQKRLEALIVENTKTYESLYALNGYMNNVRIKHIAFMRLINSFKSGLEIVYNKVRDEAIKNELPIPTYEEMWDDAFGPEGIPIILEPIDDDPPGP